MKRHREMERNRHAHRQRESMVCGKREREESGKKGNRKRQDSEGPGRGIGREAHLFIHSVTRIY